VFASSHGHVWALFWSTSVKAGLGPSACPVHSAVRRHCREFREVRLKEANASARALGVQLQVVEARGPADLDRAFLEISAKGARALLDPPAVPK
jgi:hypothetical protein